MTSNAEPSPTIVYSPKSQLRSPGTLFRGIWRDLKASRGLAWRLLVRDISARYRQSLLGILWAFIPPIITTAVFVFLKGNGTLNIGETAVPYPLYVMTGTILWALFTASIKAPLAAVKKSKAMLSKINFPREALLLSAIGNTIFAFLIKVVLLIAVFIYFRVPVTWVMLLAPVAVIMLILLGTVIGMFLVPLGSLYTDVGATISSVLGLWFFLTPVVYPPPERWPYSLLAQYNPVSPLLLAGRDMLTRGTMTHVGPFVVVSCCAVLASVVVLVVYRVSLPIIIERMSA